MWTLFSWFFEDDNEHGLLIFWAETNKMLSDGYT